MDSGLRRNDGVECDMTEWPAHAGAGAGLVSLRRHPLTAV